MDSLHTGMIADNGKSQAWYTIFNGKGRNWKIALFSLLWNTMVLIFEKQNQKQKNKQTNKQKTL